MCPGTRLPHSGQVWRVGRRQRLAPRRMRCFIFEVLRFGTAMAKERLVVVRFFQRVESCPSAVTLRGGRDVYIISYRLVHR